MFVCVDRFAFLLTLFSLTLWFAWEILLMVFFFLVYFSAKWNEDLYTSTTNRRRHYWIKPCQHHQRQYRNQRTCWKLILWYRLFFLFWAPLSLFVKHSFFSFVLPLFSSSFFFFFRWSWSDILSGHMRSQTEFFQYCSVVRLPFLFIHSTEFVTSPLFDKNV